MSVKELYLEDFKAGQTFRAGSFRMEAEAITRFAAEFDPQPFHLDPAAAAASFFGGLVASGWHTAAATMRLLVAGGLPVAGGVIGAGGDEIRWPRPVRPGDTLSVETEILEVRPSRSNPKVGLLKVRMRTLNQNDEDVQVAVANILAPTQIGRG
ncbi:MaoC family dehydratase [Mesorhizobium sp.]|uniref:MaoC family dehydratase n=1 Tax=Mesorhizobium sp. TaxID=1871066 RepID=UPI000FE51CE7|nr:MaoC family dehydratase [Mesorhizobium sp.]RWE71688.1 MAG: MaoC family dehydratase [Mesorhizobium sp.]TIV29123.1 MAG: MaoC family dehydratase [Mesorhizobium sp.]